MRLWPGKRPQPPEPVVQLHEALAEGDSERISAAVAEAEAHTSAEIIVRLCAGVPDEVHSRAVAEQEFTRLGLAGLAAQNGVLIYVALNRRRVEIVVGPAAAQAIEPEIWQQAVEVIAAGFINCEPARAIIEAVALMADPLASHFPPGEGPAEELPNVSEEH